jgi:hypothetical protein
MPVAGNRIASSGRIDTNVRPEYSGRNLYRGHGGDRDALLRAAKQSGLDAQHVLRSDHNTSGKEKIPSRQTAGREHLGLWSSINHAEANSHPFQSAFFPDPDVAHDQDGEEDQHLNQSKHAERLELHRPGKQEDGLHIEDHE